MLSLVVVVSVWLRLWWGSEDVRIVATYAHDFATIRFYGCHGVVCGSRRG